MAIVLFETTESVIEVLWDIVLAIYIIRIAFAYFLLTFTSGILLSYTLYRQLQPVTHLTTPQAELALIPIQVVLMALWSRVLIRYYEVPRVLGFRLAIGGLACAMMVGAECLLAFVLYEEGWAGWIWEETDWRAEGALGASLAVFALLPALLIGVEGRGEERDETAHGHEGKSLLDAVYVGTT